MTIKNVEWTEREHNGGDSEWLRGPKCDGKKTKIQHIQLLFIQRNREWNLNWRDRTTIQQPHDIRCQENITVAMTCCANTTWFFSAPPWHNHTHTHNSFGSATFFIPMKNSFVRVDLWNWKKLFATFRNFLLILLCEVYHNLILDHRKWLHTLIIYVDWCV